MAVSLELLTDEDILDYTKGDNGGNDKVIVDHHDVTVKGKTIKPYKGGVFDVDIFGSPFEDRCMCGHIRQVSNEPCPNCGARVFSKEEGLRRFARIELPFYYLNDLRFDIFKEFFDSVFADSTIKLDFFGDDLRRNGYSTRGGKKLGIKAFDTCQFTYSKAKKELTVSEFITDESKCSYEGLMKIIEKYFPDRFNAYRRLINRYYLVLPARMRPFSVTVMGGDKKKIDSPMSVWYTIIVALCVPSDKDANPNNYEDVMSRLKTPGERVRYQALLRAFLNSGKKMTTELLNTSKKNEARKMYSVRVPNSMRAPIIPSTTLAVDEIGVPISLAYEMCREGFCKYLMNELNFTWEDAKKATKEEAMNPETQKLFKKYAEQQIVLVFRLVLNC